MFTSSEAEDRFRGYLDSDDFYRYVRAICSKMLVALTASRFEAVEDAVLEILAKAWVNRTGFTPQPNPNSEAEWRDAFKRWIAQVARNHCLDILRRLNRRGEILSDDHTLPEPTDDPLGEAFHENAALRQCLQKLREADEKEYLAVILFYLDDCTYDEIADLLNVTYSQARTLVKNGLLKLQACLTGAKNI